MPNKYLPSTEFVSNPRTAIEEALQSVEDRLWYARPYPGAASGAPTTGTWAVDELYIDADRVTWRCTVAGTPGTWVQHGGGAGPGGGGDETLAYLGL